jgi:hypothetical protein
MVVRRRNRRDDIHRRSLLAGFDGAFVLEEFEEYFGVDAKVAAPIEAASLSGPVYRRRRSKMRC